MFVVHEKRCILIVFQMYTTKLGKDVLEAQGVNKLKPIVFSCVLFLLFVSRAIYDLITVTITVVNKEEMHAYGFGSSWMATDMVKVYIHVHVHCT